MNASRLIGAVAVLALAAGPALAAPCNTGSMKAKSPDQQASNAASSDADRSSKNLAGGTQPASPGTVGAMNNAGSAQTSGQSASNAQPAKSNDTDPAAKNLAGGQQPASPGTVGAMNNAVPNQGTGQKDDGC